MINKLVLTLLFAAGPVCGYSVGLPADTVKTTKKEAKADAKKDKKKDDKKDEKKKLSEYEKLVKMGGSKKDGMFTVRHIKKDWYIEVPDTLIGRLLLVVTRFESVPQGFKMMSGEEVNRSAVYFEQYDDNTLFMREYVKSQTADKKDKISEALSNNTIDPIVYKFDVIGRNPKTKAQLINVSKLFLSDNKVTSFSSSDKTVVNVGSLAADRTFIDTIQTYPINVEVKTLRTYSMTKKTATPASHSGSVTLSLNTSIVMLPKEPMQPRLADERVGYFENKFTRFSDTQQTTDHEAIISRYRLEPKNEKAYLRGQLSEPKKQIVYYIDPATPKKWVKYLKAGIDDWNVAFEAAGFKNAIVAKEWPPKDKGASVDDARYCVLRYLPSETQNAYGPRIVDPRSGEIIESHICWYHNVMNLLKRWYMTQCGPLDAKARKMQFDDELMGELIRFVSSHEVGHTLGLRHNMIASSATPVEKLRDKKWVEAHGHTASIMDYARFNYVAQPEDGISEKGLFPRINDYDKWAIKWGYQWRPEFKGDEYKEKKALRAEVSKVLQTNHRLRYLGDEGRGQDPRSQTEDLGDNSVKASDYGIKNLKRVVDNLLKWTAQPDGQFDDLENIYEGVRGQYRRYVGHVQRNVGGMYTNNWPAAAKKEYVPKGRQKEAIEWFGRNLFTAPLWLYPENVVNKLNFDAVAEIRSRQSSILSYFLSTGLIYRIHEASLRTKQPYQVDEYLNDVFHSVWRPLNAKDARLNDYRRQLENAYVDFVKDVLIPDEKKAGAASVNTTVGRSDVMLYLIEHLDKIDKFAASQQAVGINKLHYQNIQRRIKQIRKKLEE